VLLATLEECRLVSSTTTAAAVCPFHPPLYAMFKFIEDHFISLKCFKF
jgi:hypothetical protein